MLPLTPNVRRMRHPVRVQSGSISMQRKLFKSRFSMCCKQTKVRVTKAVVRKKNYWTNRAYLTDIKQWTKSEKQTKSCTVKQTDMA